MRTGVSEMHLYVMQNRWGLIKVGRSADPARRLIALERQLGGRIVLIAVIPGRGDFEETMHLRLDAHRFYSEWFSGCETCRRKIERGLRLGPVKWKYRWDRKRAQKWAGEQWLAAIPARVGRERLRLIGRLKGLECGLFGPLDDGYHRAGDSWIDYELHERIHRCFNPSYRMEVREIPAYTRDLDIALTLWPEDARPPPDRFGKAAHPALACAIAGLGARWAVDTARIAARLA